MKALTSVLVCALLVGCSSDRESLISSAQDFVADMLKDPESARFRGIFLIPNEEKDGILQDIAICGVVDGKNSFGAYTGGQRFVAYGYRGDGILGVHRAYLEGQDRRPTPETYDTEIKETIFESIHWNAVCVDGEHPPTYSGDKSTL